MFILIVFGVVHFHFDVSKVDTVVGELPDFFLGLLVGVICRFFQVPKEATIEDLVAEDNVGHKHFKMIYYKIGFYLGVWFRKILFFLHYFFLIRFNIHLSLLIGNIIFFLFFILYLILNFLLGILLLFLLFRLFRRLLVEDLLQNLRNLLGESHILFMTPFDLLQELLTEPMCLVRLQNGLERWSLSLAIVRVVHRGDSAIDFYSHNSAFENS